MRGVLAIFNLQHDTPHLGGKGFGTARRTRPQGLGLAAPAQRRGHHGTAIDRYPHGAGAGFHDKIGAAHANGLREGTPIRFKGLDVGKIESIDLSEDLQSVLLKARITEVPERIARVGSQFWVVKPELGLMKTANLETLVTGQYLEVQPASKQLGRQTSFVALEQAPDAAVSQAGLSLVLSAARRGSLKEGVPVTYREVTVGKVTGYELGNSADRVLVHILIEPRYAPLVRSGSRFWNTSGFGVDFGLFKGATIRTESLETLVQGGIAFATPDGDKLGTQARPEQTFPLFDKFEDEWLQWAPKIPLGK